ncbi:MAG TPA: hypothetical protein VJ768_02800 [Anaerolineales bacterium]|nr:hypothetical protein [Anaerolineales bacterium]
MRERAKLPPLPSARQSPRMGSRAGLDPEHRHTPKMSARADLGSDFRDFDRERFELAKSLLAQQASRAGARGFAALLIALGGILLSGLTISLYFQAIEIHSQSSLLRLLDALLVLLGLISAFFCLLYALRAALHRRNPPPSNPDAPSSTIFFDPAADPGDTALSGDPLAFSREFLGSSRRQILDGALEALFLGSQRAAMGQSDLRRAAVFLLLSFGALMVLVLLTVIGTI